MAEPQSYQKRQTAYKVRIVDIINSKYIIEEGFKPNYLEVNGQEVSRVNVIGVAVQKSEVNNYKALIIDDGTGKIVARDFENKLLLDNISVGDVVLIIGRPREFTDEKYVLVEIIRKIVPVWAKVRNLELNKNEVVGDKSVDEGENDKGVIFDDTPKNKIIKLIKKIDSGEGVSIENISSEGIGNVDKIVEKLLKEGDVFEVKPGKLKVLE